jgi:hypothetical protein
VDSHAGELFPPGDSRLSVAPADSLPGGTNPVSADPLQPSTSSPEAGAPTAANRAQLVKTLQQARLAMFDHQYRAVDRVLDQAERLAVDQDQKVLVQQMRHLGQSAEQFWKLVADGLRGLAAAEELAVGSAEQLIVVVVEVNQDSITIRREGRNIKYALASMPAGLALAIARRTVDENDAESLVMFGACLATAKDVTPAYLEEARKYWEQARLRGADVDDLLNWLNASQ